MKISIFAASLIALCLYAPVGGVSGAPSPQTQQGSAPEAVVNTFYKYHFAHDMAFDPGSVKHRSVWLTPDLVKACEAYFSLPQDPDEAPDIEGDPFTGSQEYPDTYALGSATVADTMARVPVTFTWKDGHSTHGTVVLKKLSGKWLIDDVEFPDQDSVRKLLATETAPANP